MARYAVFRLLSPLLREALARGYYARQEIVTLADDVYETPPGTILIGLDDGRVIIGSREPTSRDLFAMLQMSVPATWNGGTTVVFGIGMHELARRAVATVLPKHDPFILNGKALVFGNLSRQEAIGLLVEALAVLGEINSRRAPEMLARDDGVGIERVFTRITIDP